MMHMHMVRIVYSELCCFGEGGGGGGDRMTICADSSTRL